MENRNPWNLKPTPSPTDPPPPFSSIEYPELPGPSVSPVSPGRSTQMTVLEEYKRLLGSASEDIKDTNYLQSKVAFWDKKQHLRDLPSWLAYSRRKLTRIIVHNTNKVEYCLPSATRMVLRDLVKILMSMYTEGLYVENLNESMIYIDEHDLVMLPLVPKKKIDDATFKNFTTNLAKLIRLIAELNSILPKDVGHLVRYLLDADIINFDVRVVLFHGSLMIPGDLVCAMDYIHLLLVREEDVFTHDLGQSTLAGPIGKGLKDHLNHVRLNPPFHTCAVTDPFWQIVRKNPKVKYVHDFLLGKRVMRLYGDTHIAYLFFTRTCLWHLGDRDVYSYIASTEVEEYLYTMYPLYMVEVLKIIIENELAPGIWDVLKKDAAPTQQAAPVPLGWEVAPEPPGWGAA